MNMAKFTVKGILFDLDGTIVDSTAAYLAAAKAAFLAIGLKPPERRTALEIPRRLEQNLSLDDIIRGEPKRFLDVYLKTYYAVTLDKTKPIPSVSRTLEKLARKAKLALITMRYVPKDAILRELEHFGLGRHFSFVVTALDSCRPKPSPEALIKCVKALDVDVCACMIVGDSVSDVRAGKAAGIATVAVLSGLFSREELVRERPDLILDDVTRLPNFVF